MKRFRDPRKRRHYNVLCITLFSSLSLSQSVSRKSSSRSRKLSTRHVSVEKGRKSSIPTRGGFLPHWNSPSGCLDLLRQISYGTYAPWVLYTHAGSLSGIPEIIANASSGGLHCVLLLHTEICTSEELYLPSRVNVKILKFLFTSSFAFILILLPCSSTFRPSRRYW